VKTIEQSKYGPV